MSEYETVKYEQDGAVAIVTIHRPDAMNSFNTELRRDLLAAFQIGARAERAAFAGQYDRANRLVAGRALKRREQIATQLGVERVHRVGPMNRNDRDSAVLFVLYGFIFAHRHSHAAGRCSSAAARP